MKIPNLRNPNKFVSTIFLCMFENSKTNFVYQNIAKFPYDYELKTVL